MDHPEDKEKGFKVEDRRRFSSEGDLKPEHREAEDRAAAAAPTAAPAAQQQSATAHAGDAIPPAEINFSTFVVGLSTQVLLHLGEIPDPSTGQSSRDLVGAQQLIDILGMLQEKTQGNLDAAEQHLIETILFDLRMKYVEIARPPAG